MNDLDEGKNEFSPEAFEAGCRLSGRPYTNAEWHYMQKKLKKWHMGATIIFSLMTVGRLVVATDPTLLLPCWVLTSIIAFVFLFLDDIPGETIAEIKDSWINLQKQLSNRRKP